MTQTPQQTPVLADRLSTAPAQVALWFIVVLLAVIATLMLVQPHGSAIAQPAGPAGAAGRSDASSVYVIPAQLDSDQWGAFLVDARAGTLVLYQYNPNARKLKLVAARTFVYDRYLEDYNTDPSPADIADLIAKAKRVGAKQPDEPGQSP